MRQIGSLPVESEARRLSDYLLTLNIPTKILPESDRWSLWVVHEDQRDRGAGELQSYLTDSGNPKYGQSRSQAEAIRREQDRIDRLHRKNTKDLNGSWATTTGSARSRPITSVLFGLSLAVGIVTLFGSANRQILVALMTTNPSISPQGEVEWGLTGLAHGQIWRLITPIFIHFSPMHLFFNMTNLWSLGGLIESRRASRTMLILSVVTGIGANIGQVVFGGFGPSGGMSGVICGLFGYVWITGWQDPGSGLKLTQNSVLFFLIFLALCTTGLMGPIANAAHFTGLAVGMTFAAFRF